MTNETWQPVEGIDFENVNRDVLEVITVESTHVAMSHTDHGVTVYPLPENLRLCERVEPEAITQQALRREGWEVDEMGNAQYVIDGENSRFITVSRIQEVFVHDGRDSVPFHHCETMQDLRALVRMLGGAE